MIFHDTVSSAGQHLAVGRNNNRTNGHLATRGGGARLCQRNIHM